MKIDLIVKERPSLNSPVIVCGLPGSAFVGKFAVDHLISELSAKILAEIYSDCFPPQVTIKEDGTATLIKNELFYCKSNHNNGGKDKRVGGRDLILYTGDAQPSTPESEYLLSEKIIDYLVKEHFAKELVTLGAFVTGTPTKAPKVYAAVTDVRLTPKMIDSGCRMMSEGAITGMNGLLLGMARLKGLTGFTLLGETSVYSFEARAPEEVLNSFSKIFGISVDFSKLEQRASEAQEVVQAIERARAQQQAGALMTPSQQKEEERRKTGYIS